jgi:hypothetical protein
LEYYVRKELLGMMPNISGIKILEFPNSPHKKANKKSVKMFLSYPN